jgi:cytoskeletal protein RodZ
VALVVILVAGGVGAGMIYLKSRPSKTPTTPKVVTKTVGGISAPTRTQKAPDPVPLAPDAAPVVVAIVDAAVAVVPDAAEMVVVVDAAPAPEVKVAVIKTRPPGPPKSPKRPPKPGSGKRDPIKVVKPVPVKPPVDKPPPAIKLPQTLSKDQLLRVVADNSARLKPCLAKDTSLKGKVFISVGIKSNGKVKFTKLTKASWRTSPAGKCIQDTVKSYRFPPFAGDPMRLTLPIDL